MSAQWPRCQVHGKTKTCYPSPAKARKYARLGHEKFPDVKLRPYACNACGYWHITHAPSNERTT